MTRGAVVFRPQLTPQEMLQLGVFGGDYFADDDISQYPADWFSKAKVSKGGFDVALNCFQVRAGQSRRQWQLKGWITADDPLGWFQWYCRFAMGRRRDVDDIQMRRWKAFGPRHIGSIRANCRPGDLHCHRRQRQALLQWAYDPFF